MYRKLALAGSLAAVGILASGCAVTDYGLIYDNHTKNVHADYDCPPGSGGFGAGTKIVDTNGKAHILDTSQVATIWGNGGSDEILNFVQQQNDGDQVLTSENLFLEGPVYGSYGGWHDDMYGTPDAGLCAITTAQNPRLGDTDIFDYSWNQNCTGSRSLSLLLSTGRYYGEAGRLQRRAFPMLDGTSITDSQVLSLLDRGTPVSQDGINRLRFDVSARTVSNLVFYVVPANDPGAPPVAIPVNMPAAGMLEIYADAGGRGVRVALDFSKRSAFPVINAFYSAIDSARAALHTTGAIEIVNVTGTVMGTQISGFPSRMRVAIPGSVALNTNDRRDYLRSQWLGGDAPAIPVDQTTPTLGGVGTVGGIRTR